MRPAPNQSISSVTKAAPVIPGAAFLLSGLKMAKDKKRELVKVAASGHCYKTAVAALSLQTADNAFAREFLLGRALSLFTYLGTLFGEQRDFSVEGKGVVITIRKAGSAKIRGHFKGKPIEIDLEKIRLPGPAPQRILAKVKAEKLIRTSLGDYLPVSAPMDKFVMAVHVAVPCPETEEPEFALWSNLDKLSSPFCERPQNSKGRECFARGGYHEALLPFLNFGTFNPSHVEWLQGVVPSYHYEDEKRDLHLHWSGGAIETFPCPLNTVNKKREIEIFFLVPRVCFEKRKFYLWQYKPLNRFIPVEAFDGKCQICTGDELEFLENIHITGPLSVADGSSSAAGEHNEELVIGWDSSSSNIKPFKCNTCQEYSLIVERNASNDLYNKVTAFKGKGLCANCFWPVEWSEKTGLLLQCPRCSASTPIYQRWNRETASTKPVRT